MPAGTYISKWNKAPVAVRQFILRAAAILLVWKVLYLVFLAPNRVLDKPLSHSVALGTTLILNTWNHTTDYTAKSEFGDVVTDDGVSNMPLDNVYFRKRNIVSIEDGCNALELFVLYAGFIVCMPTSVRRKLVFTLGGIALIYVVNVLRCAGIAYFILYDPKHADFAHHYVFTFIVYGLIIALWLMFSNKLNLDNTESE